MTEAGDFSNVPLHKICTCTHNAFCHDAWTAECLAGKVWATRNMEKCQLLCFSYHSKKTILESGKKIARGNHGTVSTVRYCKCELCKKAKREYMREYRRERRTRTIVA